MPICLHSGRVISFDDVQGLQLLREFYRDLSVSSQAMVGPADLELAPLPVLHQVHEPELGLVARGTVISVGPKVWFAQVRYVRESACLRMSVKSTSEFRLRSEPPECSVTWEIIIGALPHAKLGLDRKVPEFACQ